MSEEGSQPSGPSDSATLPLSDPLRAQLMARPDLILDDRDLMRALIGARETQLGENVIDIRGRAMQALEDRLERLETVHETVISTAYDNQSGTNTVHRAILALLEPQDFPAFLEALHEEVAPILHIESLYLVIEAAEPDALPGGKTLGFAPIGRIAQLISAGRRAPRGNDIILRPATQITENLHDHSQGNILSEALIPLDLGPAHGTALILMGAKDRQRFAPSQGTDLLRFFAQVFRLALLRWLQE